jgi:hypothetical protein
MNPFSIGITTFSLRYSFLPDLLCQIRKYVSNPITIVINGEKDGAFDETYRMEMLSLCSEYPSIYPIFFQEMRGLSKLWNTAVIHSVQNDVLLLNDDITINDGSVFDETNRIISDPAFSGITRINGSFSHFVVRKSVLDDLCYFDERLLGFGEEDGDITYRMLNQGRVVGNADAGGLVNHVSNVRHEHVIPGIGKYSNFNRSFVYGQKYQPSNEPSAYQGMFDTKMSQRIGNESQYPYESFFQAHKDRV